MAESLAYEFVLFDWDGCLAKTLPVWMDGIAGTGESFGLHPTREDIARNFGNWSGPVALGLPEEDLVAFNTQLHAYVTQHLPEVDLYAGGRELVMRLKTAGARTALITTGMRPHFGPAFERHGLADFFDVVISGEEVEHHKPHPEPLEKAMSSLGASKESTVMIGDSDKDIGAAVNANVDSILIHGPDHRIFYDLDELRQLKPTYVVESFDEAAKLLFTESGRPSEF